MGYLFDLMLIPGATLLWASREYYYLLADESSKLSDDGKTFTYVVRDGLTWNNGESVTARDVYTTWLLRWANNHTVFSYVDRFEQLDERTVTFHIGTPAPITEYYLLRERPIADSVYGKWARQMEGKETNDDPGVVDVLREVEAFKPKSAVVSGPFEIEYDTVSNSQLTLIKNSKGYRADDINFDQIIVYNGELTDEVAPLFLNKDVDYGTYGFPPATEQQFAKIGYTISRPPIYHGFGVYFSFGKCPEFKDKRVRQAIACALDRKQNGRLSHGESGKGCELMAGMSDTLVRQWMLPEDQDRLEPYDYDPMRAETLLTDAGWEKRGDRWHTPDGNAAEYELMAVADWVGSAKDLEEQLTQFGIKITRRSMDSTLVAENLYAGKSEIALQLWGSAANPFPSDAYRVPLINFNYPALEVDGNRGIDFDMQQHTDIVGDIDFVAAITAADQGPDEESLKPNVGRLALAFNELLPVVPIFERFGQNPILEERIAGWPPPNDPIYRNSIYADNFTTILMYEGKLKERE